MRPSIYLIDGCSADVLLPSALTYLLHMLFSMSFLSLWTVSLEFSKSLITEGDDRREGTAFFGNLLCERANYPLRTPSTTSGRFLFATTTTSTRARSLSERVFEESSHRLQSFSREFLRGALRRVYTYAVPLDSTACQQLPSPPLNTLRIGSRSQFTVSNGHPAQAAAFEASHSAILKPAAGEFSGSSYHVLPCSGNGIPRRFSDPLQRKHAHANAYAAFFLSARARTSSTNGSPSR